MKLSCVGGAARQRWRSTALLLAALGSCPNAFAQDEAVGESDDADSADDGEDLGESAADPDEDVAGSEEAATQAPADAEAPPPGNPEWHSQLRILVGSRLINRTFRYTDPLSDYDPAARQPVDYPRFTLPMPRAEVRWYPAGHFTNSWLSQLGLVGGYEIEVGAQLSYNGAPVSETHDLWFLGARGRIPIGDVALGLQVDYASHRLTLSGDEVTDPELLPVFPDVVYSQVEIGADFEWRIEQLIVGLHGSYNILLGLGPIGDDINPGADPTPWFPGSTGTAVDFGAYAGWRLSPVFDVLVGLDMRAYGLDFGSIPPGTVNTANRVIAGGAIDRYMSAWLALAIKLPAKGEATAAAASTEDGAATSSDSSSSGASDDSGFD
jgi:hypothetical protein